MILLLSAENPVAQTVNYHTEAGTNLSRIEKDLAEAQKGKAGAEAAAATFRKEEAAAKKQVNNLRAQKAKAKTPEGIREFEDSIAKAQADADRAAADAQKLETSAKERESYITTLQFDRLKYQLKTKEEEKQIRDREEAVKLNDKKRKGQQPN
jgi:chromosome segregation ATPase